jgi:hypothetical protein
MSKSDEKVFGPEQGVTDLERVVTAQSAKDDELVTVNTTASEHLPFSKARCVALVATVAAAPFLSVSECAGDVVSGADLWVVDDGGPGFGYYSPDYRRGFGYTDE